MRGRRGIASRPVIYHRTALIPNSLFAFLTHGLMGYGVSFFSSFWMAEPHPVPQSLLLLRLLFLLLLQAPWGLCVSRDWTIRFTLFSPCSVPVH